MADWNPQQQDTLNNIADDLKPAHRRQGSKLPENAQNIQFRSGNSVHPTNWFMVREAGETRYVDGDGNELTGQQREAAERWGAAQAEGKIWSIDQNGPVDVGDAQQRTSRESNNYFAQPTPEQNQQARDDLHSMRERENAQSRENARTLMEGRATPTGLTWRQGQAVIPLEQPTENGMVRVNYQSARDLSPDQARELYQRTFQKAVPSDKSPQEALSEELRNMRYEDLERMGGGGR